MTRWGGKKWQSGETGILGIVATTAARYAVGRPNATDEGFGGIGVSGEHLVELVEESIM